MSHTVDISAPGYDSQTIKRLLETQFEMNVHSAAPLEGWIRVKLVGHRRREVDVLIEKLKRDYPGWACCLQSQYWMRRHSEVQ